MPIIELYSKRQRALNGDVPDIYSYENLPDALRVQIIHIWNDTIGNESDYYNHTTADARDAYKLIVDSLCREYGMFKLPTAGVAVERMFLNELANFFLQEKSIEIQLDIVELSFRVIDRLTRGSYLRRIDSSKIADEAIEELNVRFKEHGIGYQFVEGEIVRVDSELIHSEVVKPALKLLNEENYKGAQQEFLSAHEHYRHGNNKEALNDCLKSFESTMIAICDKHKWTHAKKPTAKMLIQTCFEHGLIEPFWQQQFTSLRSSLESGIPTGRNNLGAHGQGKTPTDVPDYLTAYMLHMTASTLVFLTTAEKTLNK